MVALRAVGFAAEQDKEWNGIAWWEEMDSSVEWQRELFYALCASYSLVSLIALVQLIRIQLRVPEYGWTTQKLFHLMNFLVNGLRAVLFGLYHSVFLLKPRVFFSGLHYWNRRKKDSIQAFQQQKFFSYTLHILFLTIVAWNAVHTDSWDRKVLEMALLDFPGLLFFSTYTLLVLFWAEIYHQARSLPIDKLRPSYMIINGVVYGIQICIWIYAQVSPKPVAMEIAKLFLAAVSFFAALGFLIYGGRLFFMLRRFPIESKGRRKKLNEVGFVTGICCACFLIRCIVVAISAFDEDADVDVLEHPVLNFIFYMLVEILPSALVLFILRKLPPKRVSDQYHPIN